MIMTLEIPPDIEVQVRDEAAKAGVDPQQYIVRTLTEQLRQREPLAPHLSSDETTLLKQVNLGLSQASWQRYHALIAKRQAETLTPDEQRELIDLSDQIEAANVRRIGALVNLHPSYPP